MHTAKGSSSENSVRGKGRATAGLLQRLHGRPDYRHTESTRLPGPLAGVYCPDTRRLIPWAPRKCMTEVGSLALSSPAETCAGGWGLILRVWVPAHSPNSGEAAPEARPAGGALRARLLGESTASREASLLGGKGGSPAPSSGKPCLQEAKCASSTAEL